MFVLHNKLLSTGDRISVTKSLARMRGFFSEIKKGKVLAPDSTENSLNVAFAARKRLIGDGMVTCNAGICRATDLVLN